MPGSLPRQHQRHLAGAALHPDRLDGSLGWWDVTGLGQLGGIGFTVSLLIADLSYGSGTAHNGHARIGVLAGSLVVALLATVVLRLRDRHHRRLAEIHRIR